jgi:hypothetical protein
LSGAKLGMARLVGANVWKADFAGADSSTIIAIGLDLSPPDKSGERVALARSIPSPDDRQCVDERFVASNPVPSVAASLPMTGKMTEADQEAERQALAERLADLVCNARDEDVRSVLHGLIRDDDLDSIVRDTGFEARRFFDRIMDANCSAAPYLTSEDKAALVALKNAILASEAPR